MKGEYEGKYSIVWNDRDVEMDCVDKFKQAHGIEF